MSEQPARVARERDRARREAAEAERAKLDDELDRAAHLASYLPPPLGAAIAELLSAGKPFVAADGHLSIAALGRHSPEVVNLARAVTISVTASVEADNAERADLDHCRREGRG